MVNEGFMHIDITEKLKHFINLASKKSTASKPGVQTPSNDKVSKQTLVHHYNAATTNKSPPPALKITPYKSIRFEIKLADNDEYNISHISISAVTRRSTNEVKYSS